MDRYQSVLVFARVPFGRDAVRHLPRYPAAVNSFLSSGEARCRIVPCRGGGKVFEPIMPSIEEIEVIRPDCLVRGFLQATIEYLITVINKQRKLQLSYVNHVPA